MSQPTICDWESGKKVPSFKNTVKIANYFGVATDFLLGNDDASVRDIGLVIPNELDNIQVAFHRGEFEDLTQDEVDKLAEFAKFIKTQRR